MNLYEVEIENEAQGFTLLHHIKATDEANATARALKHWKRAVVGVKFLRACRPLEIQQQLQKDLMPVPDPSDVRFVP